MSYDLSWLEKKSMEEPKKEQEKKETIKAEILPKKAIIPIKENSCPTCNRKYNVAGEIELNKAETTDWIVNCLKEKNDAFTLDFLRGQKLVYESIAEMRK